MNKVIQGDSLQVLKNFPSESVHCVVTSPPYFGLRDYGVSGQIGLEETPELFVGALVEVFKEIGRVLKNDGVVWLNLGDSYASTPTGSFGSKSKLNGAQSSELYKNTLEEYTKQKKKRPSIPKGLKHKDLIGIPWRVAFALQADGWYLRQDIIWHKPNPMPESVLDRCTRAHEYIFMFSKNKKYYYDAESIKTPVKDAPDMERRLNQQAAKNKSAPTDLRNGIRPRSDKQAGHGRRHAGFNERWDKQQEAGGNGAGFSELNKLSKKDRPYLMANKRSVWSVTTKPFKEAHFATFPEDLIEPMILAGCPFGGVVLDPFFGAGTTGVVASKLGRNYLGIELNPAYIKIAEERIANITPSLLAHPPPYKVKL